MAKENKNFRTLGNYSIDWASVAGEPITLLFWRIIDSIINKKELRIRKT